VGRARHQRVISGKATRPTAVSPLTASNIMASVSEVNRAGYRDLRTRRIEGVAAPDARPRRRKRWHFTPLAFLCPVLFLLLAFRIAPMFYGAWLSFTNWNGIGSPKYVGLQNYRFLLSDPSILTSLRNNVFFCLFLLVGMLAPLAVASLLHHRIWGWRVFRVIFFVPAAMSPLIVGTYWAAVLQTTGPFAALFRSVGLHSLSRRLWLIDPATSLPTIGLILLWASFGVGVVFFMAGLAGINPSLYDAARVDGATTLRLFRHVTLPALAPVLVFWAIQVVIFTFTNLFAFIYSLTGGGPGYSTSVIEFSMYNNAFQSGFIGYAAAVGMFMLAIVVVIVVIIMWMSHRRIEEAAE
jgi:ABC-type sugar transport system permease subunit